MCVCMCACMCVHVCVCVCMHVHLCACMRAYVCVYLCAYAWGGGGVVLAVNKCTIDYSTLTIMEYSVILIANLHDM